MNVHECVQKSYIITRFKVNNRNARKRCGIYSKLTIKSLSTPNWRHCLCSGVFIVNFEHILYVFLVSRLLTLYKKILIGLLLSFYKKHKNVLQIVYEEFLISTLKKTHGFCKMIIWDILFHPLFPLEYVFTKDILLNMIEHECKWCDISLFINGRF